MRSDGDPAAHAAARLAEALRIAREVLDAYLAGGPEPDAAAVSSWVEQSAELARRVGEERRRRALVRLGALVDRSGRGGPRFDDCRSGERPLGLLSQEDALGIVRDWLLPTDVVGEYVALQPDTVQHADGCAAKGVSGGQERPGPFGQRRPAVGFTAEPAESLSTEEVQACRRTVDRLRGHLPHVPAEHPVWGDDGPVACARRHVGDCSSCGAWISRLGVQVRLDVEGWRVAREYGLVGS